MLAQAKFEGVGKEMSKMDAIVIEEYFRVRQKWGGRVIGIPTKQVHMDYVEWMKERYQETKRGQYKNAQVRQMFTRYAKDILNVEVVTRRIHGKRERVFWDSGATRLDLGTYLD